MCRTKSGKPTRQVCQNWDIGAVAHTQAHTYPAYAPCAAFRPGGCIPKSPYSFAGACLKHLHLQPWRAGARSLHAPFLHEAPQPTQAPSRRYLQIQAGLNRCQSVVKYKRAETPTQMDTDTHTRLTTSRISTGVILWTWL